MNQIPENLALPHRRLDKAGAEPRFLDEVHRIPLLVQAELEHSGAVSWSAENRVPIEEMFSEFGALLFRGFELDTAEQFAEFSATIGGAALSYVQRSTKRHREAKGVYTSTEYPSHKSIALHSENSFQAQWPRRIVFWAVSVASEGGATPIADNRSVYEAIDANIVEEFAKRRLRYRRNFGEGLELPWQEAFQTDQKADVEAYCQLNGIRFEWITNSRLRTEQELPAVIRIPGEGCMVWFNQAHLFHVTNLDCELREALLEAMPEEDLPRHCYFGDGGRIPDQYFENIRAAYERCTVRFAWERNDIMLLDNLRMCHGRDAYSGPRKVLVSMSDPSDFSRFS